MDWYIINHDIAVKLNEYKMKKILKGTPVLYQEDGATREYIGVFAGYNLNDEPLVYKYRNTEMSFNSIIIYTQVISEVRTFTEEEILTLFE